MKGEVETKMLSKLPNFAINNVAFQVKIGDFGLATTVDEGERKRTLCGTPNYIAPEVLEKRGHSFEVDIWAIGCILYTLLFGKPPFETESLKVSRMNNHKSKEMKTFSISRISRIQR